MFAYNITNDAIVLVDGARQQVIPRHTPQAEAILEELRKPRINEARVFDLASKNAREFIVSEYSDGRLEIKSDGSVLFDKIAVEPLLAGKIVECFETGVPFKNLAAFLVNVRSNLSYTVQQQLFGFLQHNGICIAPDGRFLAYKGVNEDYTSKQANTTTRVLRGRVTQDGRIFNVPGSTIEVDRACVEDNPNVPCGPGIHVGSFEYASDWGPKVVLVAVYPAHVVSVPTDHDAQKLRACQYEVISDCTGQIRSAGVRDVNNPQGTPCQADPDDDPEQTTVEYADLQDDAETLGYDAGVAAHEAAAAGNAIAALAIAVRDTSLPLQLTQFLNTAEGRERYIASYWQGYRSSCG